MVLASRGAAILLAAAILAGCGAAAERRTTPARSVGSPAMRSASPRAAAPPPESTRASAGDRSSTSEDGERHAGRAQLAVARGVARAFLISYLAYLYGELAATRVIDMGPGLGRELRSGSAETTPAERSSRPRITRLSVITAGPPVSVVTTALVRTGHDETWRLGATLEPSGPTWRVVAISG